MGVTIGMVTVDSVDPPALARFWTAALDTEITVDVDGDFMMLAPNAPGGPAFALQRVAEPRSGKNRVHVDLRTDDRPAEVARLVDLGAKVEDEHRFPGLAWTVLTDPEGNVFCVGSHAEG